MQLDQDLDPRVIDRMCIELLVEALQIEDYTIQTNALKFMQSLVWNRYFTGAGFCSQFSEYKERLKVPMQLRIEPVIQSKESSIVSVI